MRAEFAYEEAQKYLRQRNWLALVAGGLAVTTLFGVGAAATRDREVVLVPVTSGGVVYSAVVKENTSSASEALILPCPGWP